ncbi:putative EGF-like domain-containing protein [Plasmopara halstedii]
MGRALEIEWILFVLHVLSIIQIANAACANSCSGHGRCGSSNQCICDADWALAPDCSMRRCPVGVAWTDKARTTNLAHAHAECSNRGVCDYSRGECTCFDGYSGAACQRLRCPSNCSGHGMCYSSAILALRYGPDSLPNVAGDGVGPVYSNWEKDSVSSCMCDMGYTGPDCSQLMCAKNDDPLTTGQVHRQIQIQVGADASSNLALAGLIQVRFLGDVAAFDVAAAADSAHEQACAQAIMNLRSVLKASCTITSVDPVTRGAIYTVTFQEWVHLGGENNLLFHTGNPPLSSFTCDLTKVTSLNLPSCVISDVTTANVIEHEYCSNRGLCDFTTGQCLCYADFKGLDCHQPSYIPDSIDDNDGFVISPMGLTYTGTVLHLKTAKGSQADFNFLKIESSTLPILIMNGMGDTKIQHGDLELSTGSLTIATSAQSATAADVANTHATFAGTTLKIRTTRSSNSAYKLLEAMTGDSNPVVEIRGDGLTTIYTGGLKVVSGGGTISHDLDVPSLTVTNSYSLFSNSLMKLAASRPSLFPSASDFILIEASANNVPAFTVEASGRTTIANGGLVVAGNGGAQVFNGDLASPALLVQATETTFGGDAIAIQTFSSVAHRMLQVTTKVGNNAPIPLVSISNSGLTTIMQGGLHVVAGGATIDTGGFHVVYGGGTIDFGGLRIKNGGSVIELGGLDVIDGGGSIASTSSVADIFTVEATSASFSNNARVLYINSKSTVLPSTSMHYLIEAAVGATPTSVFKVDATGLTTVNGQGKGGVIISDRAADATSTLAVTNTAGSGFAGSLLSMSATSSDQLFSFIDGKSSGTSVFKVDATGLTTIVGQGSGGAMISDNSATINTLMISNRLTTGFTSALLKMNAISTSKLYTLIDAQSSGTSRFKVAASGLTTIVGSGGGGAIISDSNAATTSTLDIRNTDMSRSFSGTLLGLDTSALTHQG